MEPTLFKILVVDDNTHTRRILKWGVGRLMDAITEQGGAVALQICEAEEGGEAVKMLSAERFDLVLTDYYMPVMDGAEIIRRMRANHPHTPILATSASEDVRDRLMEAGASAFIGKPMQSKELVAQLKTLLHLR